MLKTIRFLLFLVFFNSVYGQEQIPSIQVYEDTSNTLTIETITALRDSLKFTPLHGTSMNKGFSKSSFWFHIKIKAFSHYSSSKYLLLMYPLINEVHFYEVSQGNILRKIITGEAHPFKSRELHNRNYIFPIYIPKYEEREYYLYVYNHGEPLRIPLEITNQRAFFEIDVKETAYLSLYYGFIFFAAIINIFFFISIRDRVYFYFTAYITFLGLFLMNTDGISFMMLWPNSSWWANHSTILFSSASNLFLTIFAGSFLQVKRLHIWIYYAFIALCIYSLFLIFGAFTSYPFYRFIIQCVNSFTLFNVIVISIFSVVAIKHKYKPANLFLVSFIVLIGGVLVYVLRNMGYIPVNFITKYGIKLGFGIQILFLTFAVADRFRKMMNETQSHLESLVNERTHEIEMQKDEIIAQRDEIELQRDYVLKHRDQIARQNKEITDSIRYAKHIQQAVMPNFENSFPHINSQFILFKPRDIVSGDFIYHFHKRDITIIAVADCTGHGVPGGFMSMLGIVLLNEAVNNQFLTAISNEELNVSEILNSLATLVENTLKHTQHKGGVGDGMNISIVLLNHNDHKLQFAGAFHPLYFIRNNEIEEIRGERISIGNTLQERHKFVLHEKQLKPNDLFYLSTDGYMDQISEQTNKTMKSKLFKETLLEISNYSLHIQKSNLEEIHLSWKGDNDQTDDILIAGFKPI